MYVHKLFLLSLGVLWVSAYDFIIEQECKDKANEKDRGVDDYFGAIVKDARLLAAAAKQAWPKIAPDANQSPAANKAKEPL